MKKIYLGMLACIALCSSFILLVEKDEKQRQDFLLIDSGNINITIQVEGYESISFNKEFDLFVEDLSEKHNVRVLIPFFAIEGKALKLLYTENVRPLMQSNLKLDTSDALIYTTYGESANVRDILSNDYFIYESLSKREDLSLFWDGRFYIGAENEADIEKFIDDFSSHYGIAVESVRTTSRMYRNTSIAIMVYLSIALGIFLILYLLAIFQKIVSSSKKIGVLFLLGFSSWKIVQRIFPSEYKVLAFSGGLSILGFFLLPNIPFQVLLSTLFKDVVLLIMTYGICLFAVRGIIHKQSPSEILKRKHVAQKITKLNVVIQVVICIVILLIAVISSENIRNIIDNKKAEDSISYFLDYGTIYDADVNFINSDIVIANQFYNKVISDDLLKSKYIYVKFNEYRVYHKDAVVQEGYKYDDLYGVVSSNYFEIEGVKVYDDKGNEVQLKEYNEEDIFIFPRQYSHDPTTVFHDYYKYKYENYQDNYEDYNPEILYYDNQMLPTYELDVIMIDSPVLKLVRNDNETNYIDDTIGLSIYGIGLSTALKFRIDGDKEEVVNRLDQILADCGYEEFKPNHFVTVGEYLGEELYRNYRGLKMLGLVLAVMGLVVLLAQMQFVSLYLIQNHREISVKRYLGHGVVSTFGDIIATNIMVVCSSIIIVTLLNFFLKIGDWFIYFGFSILFLIFAIFTTSCIVFAQQSNIAKSLKKRGD